MLNVFLRSIPVRKDILKLKFLCKMFQTVFVLTLNWFCFNKSETLSDLIQNLRNEWMYFVICMHCCIIEHSFKKRHFKT